jgi:hypothetical protein
MRRASDTKDLRAHQSALVYNLPEHLPGLGRIDDLHDGGAK